MRAITKSATLGADIVILDLEDAVAPEQKPLARENMVGAFDTLRSGATTCAIRVNEPASQDLEADLAVFKSVTPDAVVISKLQSMEELRSVRAQLRGAGYAGPIWSMIETPRGILGLESMIDQAALLNLELVMVGGNDLSKSMKIPEGPDQRAALEPHFARILLGARAAGIPVLDSVFNAYQDTDGFRTDCEIGRAMGFDGKTLIHPNQVAIANTVFAPSEDEIEWAKAVVAAYSLPENKDKGAISLDGRMIEHLHLESAEAVLAAVDALADR